MELARIGKGSVVALLTICLSGCIFPFSARTGSSDQYQDMDMDMDMDMDADMEMTYETGQPMDEAITVPVASSAVQAVLDSGKVQATPDQIAEMLDHDVYNFDFDSDRLKSKDYLSLDAQAAYLTSEAGKDISLIIRGHTDERGTRTYNLALGERRANAVRNYLILKGIAADRIEVISYGFEKPVDPAHTDAAWARNRRAEIDLAKDSL